MHLLSMGEFHFQDDMVGVSTFVDDPVIANPQSPYSAEMFKRFKIIGSRIYS